MARKNLLGNSYLGLGLDQEHERKVKKHIKDQGLTGKQFLRFLVREYFKTPYKNEHRKS